MKEILIFVPLFFSLLLFLFQNFPFFLSFTLSKKIFFIYFNTLSINFLIPLLSTFLGLFYAYYFLFYFSRIKKLILFFIFLLFFVPPHFYTYFLIFLTKEGIISLNFSKNLSLFVFVSTLHYFPLAFFIFNFYFKIQPREIFEFFLIYKKRISLLKKFTFNLRTIFLPFIFSVLLILLLSFSDYVTPFQFSILTIQSEIFKEIASQLNFFRAFLLATIYILLTTPLIFFMMILSKKLYRKTLSSTTTFNPIFKSKIIEIISLFLLLIFNLPIILSSILIIKKVIFSYKDFVILFSTFSLYSIFSFISVLVVFMIFFKNQKSIFYYLSLFGLFPTAILATIIILSFEANFLSLFYAFLIFQLPYSSLFFLLLFNSLPKNFFDSITLIKNTFDRITFYLWSMKNQILLFSLIILSIFMWEVNIPQLLSPTFFQPLPIFIENLMHYGDYKHAFSLVFCLLIFQLLLLSIILKVGEWLF